MPKQPTPPDLKHCTDCGKVIGPHKGWSGPECQCGKLTDSAFGSWGEMAKYQLPPKKVECRRCRGDGWNWDIPLGLRHRIKRTCPDCEGRGYRMISPFEFDPVEDKKL